MSGRYFMAAIPSLKWSRRNPFLVVRRLRRPIRSSRARAGAHVILGPAALWVSGPERLGLDVPSRHLPIRGRAAPGILLWWVRDDSGVKSNPTDPSIAPPGWARSLECTEGLRRNSRKIRGAPAFFRHSGRAHGSGSEVNVLVAAGRSFLWPSRADRAHRPERGPLAANRPAQKGSRAATDCPSGRRSFRPGRCRRIRRHPSRRGYRDAALPGIVPFQEADDHVHIGAGELVRVEGGHLL